MTTETRQPHAGYREHDHVTEWQECDTCQLRTGAGITTHYDAVYYAGDPAICPRCAGHGRDGLMCLPHPEDPRLDGPSAKDEGDDWSGGFAPNH